MLNSLTAKSALAGTKNSRSEGFLLAKHLKHTAHKHHHHDGAVCPSSGMVLLDLGCTFRLYFHFLGCRNPGQDSCSGRIPAEPGRNIPDVPPFLRAGTLLPRQTGKRSGLISPESCTYMRRSFPLLASVNENYFPPIRKNNKEHKAHNIRYSLHHEYGAPQHHLPMPPTKATGGIKKNAVNTPPQHHCRRRGTRGPIWTGEGAAAPFYGVRILGEIWPVGGLIPWPNRNGRT
jgi:hypothetical protein